MSLKNLFKNPINTELLQLTVTIAWSLFFGYLTASLKIFIIFYATYEILYYFLTDGEYPYWRFWFRIACFCASFDAWLIGRNIMLKHKDFEIFKNF